MTRSITTGIEGGPSPTPSASIASTVSMFSRDLADDRVLRRQAHVWPCDDEELAARCARRLGLALRHRDDPLRVGGIGRRHVDGLVARPAASRSGRIAALDHEAGDDAMERCVVEEAAPGERDERGGCLRRRLLVELDRELAAVGLHDEPVDLGRIECLGRRLLAVGLRRRSTRALHGARAVALAVGFAAVVPAAAGDEAGQDCDRKRQRSRMGDRDRSATSESGDRPAHESAGDVDLVGRSREGVAASSASVSSQGTGAAPASAIRVPRRRAPPRPRRARTPTASVHRLQVDARLHLGHVELEDQLAGCERRRRAVVVGRQPVQLGEAARAGRCGPCPEGEQSSRGSDGCAEAHSSLPKNACSRCCPAFAWQRSPPCR